MQNPRESSFATPFILDRSGDDDAVDNKKRRCHDREIAAGVAGVLACVFGNVLIVVGVCSDHPTSPSECQLGTTKAIVGVYLCFALVGVIGAAVYFAVLGCLRRFRQVPLG